MLEDIDSSAIVGTKQVLRAMQAGALSRVYIAADTEAFLKNKITVMGESCGVEIVEAPEMKKLGEYCRIDVGAACVGILK